MIGFVVLMCYSKWMWGARPPQNGGCGGLAAAELEGCALRRVWVGGGWWPDSLTAIHPASPAV
ncbi:hypothetical protein GCM10010245_72450 [Streptomyces spectabilis]|nr:hypothetical protein GCM10010245_72450 [Streptomyces spectabilis]